MTNPRLLLPLASLCLSLTAGGQSAPQAAATASQAVPGSFVEVEGSKPYFEECENGPEAVVGRAGERL